MLRWGLLGTGFISGTVADAIAASPGSEVVAVAGRTAESRAMFQRSHGVAVGVASVDELVALPEVDVVYNGLPSFLHHEPALLAAAAGKAVLSEKSLTLTMASANALVDGVRAGGSFFAEGLMYLAHPVIERFVQVLTDGRLGDLRAVDGRYAADIWQLVNPGGRGTIYNLGCYPVSLLHLVVQTLCGADAFADRTLMALGSRQHDDGNISDAALGVRFGNGVQATLQSTDSYGMASDFAVVGSAGTVRFETNPWLPVAGENTVSWQPHDTAFTDREFVGATDPHDAFVCQVQMVERCLAAGISEAPRPSPRLSDSLEIMGMLTEWEAACS